MTTDDKHYYIYDTHLDDTHNWQTGIRDCYDCGYTFTYVHRVDQPEPECPRCTASDRWTRKPIYDN